MQPDLSAPHVYAGPLAVSANGFSGDELTTYLHAARVLLGRRGSSTAAAGLDSYALSVKTPDGSTMKVVCAAGIHRVYLSREGAGDTDQHKMIDKHVPKPMSGVIAGGNLEERDCPLPGDAEHKEWLVAQFAANDTTAKRIKRMIDAKRVLVEALEQAANGAKDEQRDMIETDLKLARFELEHLHADTAPHDSPLFNLRVPLRWQFYYNNPVTPPIGSTAKPVKFSQYKLIKPTMFTGRMRYVAQWLLGFAKQPTFTLTKQDGEFAAAYVDGVPVWEAHPDVEEPADKQSQTMLGSLRYNFQFQCSHGIYRTGSKRQYLVEISQERGVVAMRLPVIPGSAKRIEDEDTRDKLGDVPLGYTFPRDFLTKKEREANAKRPPASQIKTPWEKAVKAGWVKVLLEPTELSEFYALQPTYQECGWAFSYSGSRANNVGWSYPFPRPNDYPVFEHWEIELSGGDAGGANNVYDYRHGPQGSDKSIDSLRATIRKVGSGAAVDTSQWHKPFKVPIVASKTGVPAVVSFDMNPNGFPDQWTSLPDEYASAVKSYPCCDTVVHVFYDGEELKWLRFYNPPGGDAGADSDSWDDREPGYTTSCMVLGGYSWGGYSKPKGTPKGFYSNDFDHRKAGVGWETSMRSQGSRTWVSPFFGVAYSWPYNPLHFGYEDSTGSYDGFSDSYESAVGSPWAAQRHGFSVKVKGTSTEGSSYGSSAAIPLTDRECFFLCQREVTGTKTTYDHAYTALVMQFIYYVYPSWVPNPDLPDGAQVIPSQYEWWQLRGDTIKHLQFRWWDDEHNYTKEQLLPAATVLSISGGTITAPMNDYNNDKTTESTTKYVVETVASGDGYTQRMKADGTDDDLWEKRLPSADDTRPCAFLWCTRSLLGAPGEKMHIRLDGIMGYSGFATSVLTDAQKGDPRYQITFVGEP